MLGVIADDFTGASDIASFLVENGLSTVQMNGVPTQSLNSKVDAIVISLKSRSNPVNEAIEQSLRAYQWLKENGLWYYLDDSGAMKTGWYQVSGKWYYSYSSGELAVNTIVDGYTVNHNGEWV